MPTATHIIDIVAPKTSTKTEFVNHDICRNPWPFPDKFFDFSSCSNTLEDIRDPIGACEELMRVSRSVLSRRRHGYEANLTFFWQDKFAVEERVLVGVGEIEADFIRFKAEALRKLRRPTPPPPPLP